MSQRLPRIMHDSLFLSLYQMVFYTVSAITVL